MAELEIHQEHEVASDPFGQRVGILTSLLAVLLAIVTIASHRAHTEGVLVKTDANDKWAYYQAKSIKLHNVELGQDLMTLFGPHNEAAAQKLETYKAELKRYKQESSKTEKEAETLEHRSEAVEQRALRYDFGEGLLEISLVLSSLYFISRKRYFPWVGLIAGTVGIAIAASGLFL